MNRKSRIKHIVKHGVIAVVRLDEALPLQPVADALFDGGIKLIEITLTTPYALTTIQELKQLYSPDILIGAGSVTIKQHVQEVASAGADFIASPITKKEIIDEGHIHDLPVLSGAFTPTEAQMAYEYGADMIKIFPAAQLGLSYIKAILAPLPHLRLVPTGGVTLENAGEWIRAGAVAVGVGSALMDKELIRNNCVATLKSRASILCKSVDKANKNMGP